MKEIKPNLRTPDAELSREERNKLNSNGVRGQLYAHFRDYSRHDIVWESEQLAKSHGIYLEWHRAKTGKEKDWMYMVRISIPGGGPFTREQWRAFDELAEQYTANSEGKPSLRITTRQNIQFHWVKKHAVIALAQRIAETGFYSLNGCGDNVRNVMGCPLSSYSPLYNANSLARRFGEYFRLDAEPHIQVFEIDRNYLRTPEERFAYGDKLLNRKFKIAFSAIHFDEESGHWVPDNCVELRTNDIGVAPMLQNGQVERFQVYIGGGQGERNGKPTFSALGEPFGIFSTDELLKGLDAIVSVHRDWGDRQNRHWARMKYVLFKQGMEWYRAQVRARVGDFELPDANFDYGDRQLHHGWLKQPSNGLLAYGAFIENGRIIDGRNGQLKSMVRHLMETYPIRLMTTPNQDLLFVDIPPEAKESFEADMQQFGYGQRNGKLYSQLRVLSGACVGLDTCRLAYTDSENFEPYLIDELEKRGWKDMAESIGITGCERQCSRPATKTIGWVGSGKDLYLLKLRGSEDARNQGGPLIDSDNKMYLRQVPRKNVADLTEALFEFYVDNRRPNESMGHFHQRVGMETIIHHLKEKPQTAPFMEKTYEPLYVTK